MADRSSEPVDERSAAAFRAALTSESALGDVDPVAVRQRAEARRRQRRGSAAILGVIVVALVAAGSLAVPRLLTTPSERIAEPAAPSVPTDPAPDGWRTEYYRDISFVVPDHWGYAFAPGPDWCADAGDGRPAPQHRRPYVSLGRPMVVRSILCPEQPTSLLTEHVVVFPYPAAAEYVGGSSQRGKWWVETRVWPSAVLQVTSTDRERARRIAESGDLAGSDAPCPPTSPVQEELGARPEPVSDITTLESVEHAVVCQYDPERPDIGEVAGLRAVRSVSGSEASDLVETLAAAPPHDGSCSPPPQQPQPDIAILVALWAADGRHEVYVQAAGCPASQGSAGGIADGTTLRELTRPACQALVRPPIALQAASSDVGRNCLP